MAIDIFDPFADPFANWTKREITREEVLLMAGFGPESYRILDQEGWSKGGSSWIYESNDTMGTRYGGTELVYWVIRKDQDGVWEIAGQSRPTWQDLIETRAISVSSLTEIGVALEEIYPQQVHLGVIQISLLGIMGLSLEAVADLKEKVEAILAENNAERQKMAKGWSWAVDSLPHVADAICERFSQNSSGMYDCTEQNLKLVREIWPLWEAMKAGVGMIGFRAWKRVGGATNRGEGFVVCPDGSLRERDYATDCRRSGDGNQIWKIVEQDELAIYYEKAYTAAPFEWHIGFKPAKLTSEQVETVKRLEREIVDLPYQLGQGWGFWIHNEEEVWSNAPVEIQEEVAEVEDLEDLEPIKDMKSAIAQLQGKFWGKKDDTPITNKW